MSTLTDRRSELRTEARKRERVVLPKLRQKLRAARAHKAKRMKRCQLDCQRRKEKVRNQAAEARTKLRERLQQAKQQARELCTVCKVSATGAELDRIDQALGALEQERATIRTLRARASGMVDPRGSAAGRRSAEIRAELDDEVRRNVADDPELVALWDAQRDRYRRFAPTARTTMTERYLEWVQSHPQALDELRARQERAWEAEAEQLLAQWPRVRPIASMTDAELAQLGRDHDRAEALLGAGDEPTADVLHFAEAVHDAARDPATKRSGNAAYLRSVYNTMRRGNRAITWPQFQSGVLAAHNQHALRLKRAELVPATQRKLAKDSAVHYRDTAYHLVDVPAAIPF